MKETSSTIGAIEVNDEDYDDDDDFDEEDDEDEYDYLNIYFDDKELKKKINEILYGLKNNWLIKLAYEI